MFSQTATAGVKRERTHALGARLHFATLALIPFTLLLPPAEGTMLIVPLVPAAADEAIVWASQAEARLIGRGFLPGSLIVDGSSPALWRRALEHGAVLTRAGFAGCGYKVER